VQVAINTNSYTIQFNPAVVNSNPDGATVTNITQEIVIATRALVMDATRESI
jgi:hypothetical protein